MENDKGFFIENLLKDSKLDKCEKISEEDESCHENTTTEKESSDGHEESDWLNPGSHRTPRMTDILPTVYPVISNRLDTREGKTE